MPKKFQVKNKIPGFLWSFPGGQNPMSSDDDDDDDDDISLLVKQQMANANFEKNAKRKKHQKTNHRLN